MGRIYAKIQLLGLAALLCALPARQLNGQISGSKDLSEASIEDLMQVEVSSAARRSKPLSKTPAAVYVITSEDIRRSGATSVAEALRLAPGLQVARIDSLAYAISSRGFNGELSNKMLVMIDGRSLYVTLTGSVSWETVDTDIDNIERIEVIRGAAGATWGVNAVNGVINIITRSSKETSGSSVQAGAGTIDEALAGFRHGGTNGNLSYRIYGKSLRRDPLRAQDDISAVRDWSSVRSGFRIDYDRSLTSTFLLTGDIYDSRGGRDSAQAIPQPPYRKLIQADNHSLGGHVYGKWKKRHANGSSYMQAYFDRQYSRNDYIDIKINTMDFEYQRELPVLQSHTLLFGGGARMTSHSYPNFLGPELAKNQNYGLVNAFVQDDIALVEDKVTLTAGVKLEKNSITAANLQPTVRIAWTPDYKQTFWSAVSRANRTPSRFEQDADFIAGYQPSPFGTIASRVVGNRNLEPETIDAVEAGYRTQLRRNFLVDVALFRNQLRDLISVSGNPALSMSPLGIVATVPMENTFGAVSYGGELSTVWSPAEYLRLYGSFSRLHIQIDAGDHVFLRSLDNPRGRSPQNQGNFRVAYSPSARHAFDVNLYCVGQLPADDIAAYQRLDVRWEWRFRPSVSLSVLGQDLLRPYHHEFRSEAFATITRVKRGGSVRLQWDF